MITIEFKYHLTIINDHYKKIIPYDKIVSIGYTEETAIDWSNKDPDQWVGKPTGNSRLNIQMIGGHTAEYKISNEQAKEVVIKYSNHIKELKIRRSKSKQ